MIVLLKRGRLVSKAITISAAHTDFIVFADHFAMSAVKHLARGSPIAPRCYCGLDSELASSLPDPNGVRCIQRWALAIEDTPKMSGLTQPGLLVCGHLRWLLKNGYDPHSPQSKKVDLMTVMDHNGV